MDIRKIKKLIDLMIESDLQAIEVKEGDQSIALTRRSPVVAAGAPVAMAAPVAQAPAAKTPRGAVETLQWLVCFTRLQAQVKRHLLKSVKPSLLVKHLVLSKQ